MFMLMQAGHHHLCLRDCETKLKLTLDFDTVCVSSQKLGTPVMPFSVLVAFMAFFSIKPSTAQRLLNAVTPRGTGLRVAGELVLVLRF